MNNAQCLTITAAILRAGKSIKDALTNETPSKKAQPAEYVAAARELLSAAQAATEYTSRN